MKKRKKTLRKNKDERIDDPLSGDLSGFIAEGIKEGSWQVTQYELRERKDKVVSLRLSEKLLNELKKQAKAMGLDTQKFIRISLESIVRRKTG